MSATDRIDLGDGHTLVLCAWAPDRRLNPQYDGIDDIREYGASIWHVRPDGTECGGFLTFDGPDHRKLFERLLRNAVAEGRRWRPPVTWTMVRRDPITLTPSVLCGCGDHGWVRDGRWVRA